MSPTNNVVEEVSVVPDQESQIIIPEEQPFSEELEKERERKRIRELRPILDELDEWRKKSLNAPIRV